MRIWIYLSWIIVPICAIAKESQIYNKANQMYRSNQFEEAAVLYESLVAKGIHHADVFYNLGNTCFRLNKIGLTILNYERGAYLNPQDEDIRANLKFVNAKLVDQLPVPPSSLLKRVIDSIVNFFSENQLAWLCSLSWQGTALFLILMIFLKKFRNVFRPLSIVALILMIFFGSLWGFKGYLQSTYRHIIIIKPQLSVVSEPEGDQVIFSVHEGTKLLVRKKMNNWWLVSLPNGVSGWAKKQDFEEI